MLLREEAGGEVVAIGQPAHAWISGQLARAWGGERFGDPEPYEEVCLAAEQHDLGMAGWDAEPELNPATGMPYAFVEMPLHRHLELWTAAPHRALPQSRYAALLVSLHGTTLYTMRHIDDLPGEQRRLVRAYLDEQRKLQARLLDALRADPATAPHADPDRVEANRRLIFAWDFFSLAVCLRWAPRASPAVLDRNGDEVRIQVDAVDGHDRRFTLDPWPLRVERLAVRTEGRRLSGPFGDEAAMRAALARAPWETLRFELVRDPSAPAEPSRP